MSAEENSEKKIVIQSFLLIYSHFPLILKWTNSQYPRGNFQRQILFEDHVCLRWEMGSVLLHWFRSEKLGQTCKKLSKFWQKAQWVSDPCPLGMCYLGWGLQDRRGPLPGSFSFIFFSFFLGTFSEALLPRLILLPDPFTFPHTFHFPNPL